MLLKLLDPENTPTDWETSSGVCRMMSTTFFTGADILGHGSKFVEQLPQIAERRELRERRDLTELACDYSGSLSSESAISGVNRWTEIETMMDDGDVNNDGK